MKILTDNGKDLNDEIEDIRLIARAQSQEIQELKDRSHMYEEMDDMQQIRFHQVEYKIDAIFEALSNLKIEFNKLSEVKPTTWNKLKTRVKEFVVDLRK